MSDKFLGIDVSTTAVKALLVDQDGAVLGEASTEHPVDTPRALWSEQNPLDWWDSTLVSMRKLFAQTRVRAEEVKAIGLTGQMHGMTLLDKNEKILRPAIIWNDQRTGAQCDEIRRRVGREKLIQTSGNEALTGFTAPKILWVAQNQPEIYEKVAHILLPKDVVRWKLTGEFAADCADASGMILFDLAKRTWSDMLLDKLQIRREWLPKVYEGTEVTGAITREAAQLTGLREGTPVMGGGGDQSAQGVGVGAVRPGIVALTLGTSGVVFSATDHAFIEKEGRLNAFCHSVPGKWHLMGVVMAAAGSLKWFRDTFSPGTGYDDLLKPAEEIPVGCEGAMFLPYLTGERAPHPDPLARGAFAGLTVRHSFAHLSRAVLEGVAFALRDCYALMTSSGLPPVEQVRVSGGGARSPLWRQILADVFQAELVTVNTSEGAAYGAALLAAVGAGRWKDVADACAETIRVTGSTQPRADEMAAYDKAYDIYRSLYPALKDVHHALGGL